MVLTLRELLERIRPAGTPGAPSEGERQRRRDDRAAEVADVTAVLADFEAEADALVAEAQHDARRLCEQARQQAQQIAALLPDRVATAGAEITARDDQRLDAEEQSIRAEAEDEAVQLMNSAQAGIPALVDTAVQVIWHSITATTGQPE